MINIYEKDFLLIMFDVRDAILNNDVELAEKVTTSINEFDLSEEQANRINEAMRQYYDYDVHVGVDAINYLINNVNCVKDKQHLLNLVEVIYVTQNNTLEEQKTWLQNQDFNSIDLSVEADQLFYIRQLLNLCNITKMYDKADEIRAKLKEVM